MAGISSRQELADWLEGQKREVAVVLALRAALRVLPLTAQDPRMSGDASDGRRFAIRQIRTFRALFACAAVLRFSSDAAIRDAAVAFAADAADAAAAVVFALAADATAAAAAAAYAAYAAVAATNPPDRGAVIWRAVNRDIAMLADGADLARAELWPDGAPDWANEHWAKLKPWLEARRGGHWRFWTGWYEARLRGGAMDAELQRAIALIPDADWKKSPAHVNKIILALVEKHRKPAPKLPPQGPGAHFTISADGIVRFAPPEELDAQGNHLPILRSLHPDLRELAQSLVEQLGVGNIPHANLRDRAKAYQELIALPLEEIDFHRLYAAGLRLDNANAAARGEIAAGELPALSAGAREAADSLSQMHGTFIVATSAGAQMLANEERYKRDQEEQRNYVEGAGALAAALQDQPKVIGAAEAEFVAGVAQEIGRGANPERSGVVAGGAMRNVVLALSAGAAIGVAAPGAVTTVAIAAMGAGGLAAGWLIAQGVQKSKRFDAARTVMSDMIDAPKLEDAAKRLRPTLHWVLAHEATIRRTSQSWPFAADIGKALDWIKEAEQQQPPDPRPVR